MKKDTHPQWHTDAKVIYNGEVIMTVGATQPEIIVDIWSGVHPFFTGQQRLVDTEGQVDRFMRRLRRREEIATTIELEEQEQSSPLKLDIGAFSAGTRAENAMREADVTTVGDVFELYQEGGDDALLALPGIGQTALIAIKRFLRAEGLIE
jgi:large subunit ribosomal protein L31